MDQHNTTLQSLVDAYIELPQRTIIGSLEFLEDRGDPVPDTSDSSLYLFGMVQYIP